MDNTFPTYSNLNACALVAEPNSSYLYNTHAQPVVIPLSSPTMGLMMLLSTFQYEAPYMNPTYSGAASEVGKAAFITSGGQAIQDKEIGVFTKDGTNFAHSIGLTDTELGMVGFTAKTIRRHELNINGPKVLGIKINLTADPQSGSIGLKYGF